MGISQTKPCQLLLIIGGCPHRCTVSDVSANSNICVLPFQPIKIIRVLQYQPIKTRVKESQKLESRKDGCPCALIIYTDPTQKNEVVKNRKRNRFLPLGHEILHTENYTTTERNRSVGLRLLCLRPTHTRPHCWKSGSGCKSRLFTTTSSRSKLCEDSHVGWHV